VHAAAHRDRDPPPLEGDPRSAEPRGEPRLEPPRDRVGDELGTVAAGGPQAAPVRVAGVGGEPERVVARRPPAARAGGARRGAAPAEGQKARLPTPAAADAELDPPRVAARGRAGLPHGVGRLHPAGPGRAHEVAPSGAGIRRHRAARLPWPPAPDSPATAGETN